MNFPRFQYIFKFRFSKIPLPLFISDKDLQTEPEDDQKLTLVSNNAETEEFPDIRRHRRTRSDDMFRRKLIPTIESMRRAEQDGYKNFLTSRIPELEEEGKENKQKKVRRIYSAENILNGKARSQLHVST